MSEEKKNEVLGQEKELDESEMEAVSGGKGLCVLVANMCPMGGEEEKKECVCILAAGGK